MKKFLIAIVVFCVFGVSAQALTITGREKLYFDNGLGFVPEEKVFAPVEGIIVSPIYLPEDTGLNSDDWIRGLYYYSTVRLGYEDMPFHYVLLPNGKVYKTGTVSEGNVIKIGGEETNVALIGYLSKRSDVEFAERSLTSLKDLALKIANENEIDSQKIEVTGLRYSINLSNKTSSLERTTVAGSWAKNIESVQEYVAQNYSPIPKTYNIQIDSVKYPESKLEPGSVAIVELTLTNTGENVIYEGSDSALYATKEDGTLSKFFLNSVWASQSQVPILSEGEFLGPSETKTFQLKFNIPLYFGIQRESFVIKTAEGEVLKDSKFGVAIEVSEIDERVVEVTQTELGYLNVRDGDSGNAEIVGRVSPGERYILKQTGTYGYVQIDLGEGELGWVSQKYIRNVN